MPENSPQRGSPAREIALADIAAAVWRRRKFIAVVTLGIGALTLIVAFVVPNTFVAKVSILPPEKTERSGLSALLSSASSSMLDLSPMGENRSSDYFLDVLHSKTLVDSLFADYPDVREYFSIGAPLRSQQMEAVANAVSSEAGRDGLVTTTVQLSTGFLPSQSEQDRIAALSARIAQGIAVELEKLNHIKIVSRAHYSRIYIEEQLQRVKHQLDSLYSQFTVFQHENKVLALDKQVESEVHTAADLQSQIMELEYQLRYQLRSQTSANAETRQLQERLSSLKEQYAQLQSGGDTNDYFLPFPQIPMLQKMYANMARDLKAMEQVYAYLQTQYFQERVQEERDTPTVQVLDAPSIPDRRTSPRRLLWLVFGVLGGLVVSGGIAATAEMFLFSGRQPDGQARKTNVLSTLLHPSPAVPDERSQSSSKRASPTTGERS